MWSSKDIATNKQVSQISSIHNKQLTSSCQDVSIHTLHDIQLRKEESVHDPMNPDWDYKTEFKGHNYTTVFNYGQ